MRLAAGSPSMNDAMDLVVDARWRAQSCAEPLWADRNMR
jgi:hypothetical protein